MARKSRTVWRVLDGVGQLDRKVGEAMRAREVDGAASNVGVFEPPFSRFGHGNGEGVVRLDSAAEAESAERPLQLITCPCRHATLRSPTTPPSTFSDPERKPRRSMATRPKP